MHALGTEDSLCQRLNVTWIIQTCVRSLLDFVFLFLKGMTSKYHFKHTTSFFVLHLCSFLKLFKDTLHADPEDFR